MMLFCIKCQTRLRQLRAAKTNIDVPADPTYELKPYERIFLNWYLISICKSETSSQLATYISTTVPLGLIALHPLVSASKLPLILTSFYDPAEPQAANHSTRFLAAINNEINRCGRNHYRFDDADHMDPRGKQPIHHRHRLGRHRRV